MLLCYVRPPDNDSGGGLAELFSRERPMRNRALCVPPRPVLVVCYCTIFTLDTFILRLYRLREVDERRGTNCTNIHEYASETPRKKPDLSSAQYISICIVGDFEFY